jgi:hypothetical protein
MGADGGLEDEEVLVGPPGIFQRDALTAQLVDEAHDLPLPGQWRFRAFGKAVADLERQHPEPALAVDDPPRFHLDHLDLEPLEDEVAVDVHRFRAGVEADVHLRALLPDVAREVLAGKLAHLATVAGHLDHLVGTARTTSHGVLPFEDVPGDRPLEAPRQVFLLVVELAADAGAAPSALHPEPLVEVVVGEHAVRFGAGDPHPAGVLAVGVVDLPREEPHARGVLAARRKGRTGGDTIGKGDQAGRGHPSPQRGLVEHQESPCQNRIGPLATDLA